MLAAISTSNAVITVSFTAPTPSTVLEFRFGRYTSRSWQANAFRRNACRALKHKYFVCAQLRAGNLNLFIGIEFALPLLVRLTAAVAGGELMMCAAGDCPNR
jgi:hypothetical protein